MDTETCWTVAEAELFHRRGLGFGAEEKALLIGRSLDDASTAIAGAFNEAGNEVAIIDELFALAQDALSASVELMAGADAVVDLVDGVAPMAVASNSPRALLDTALLRGGLQDRFEFSVAADEVEHPKPAPDIYLVVCDRLGVSPSKALAFEDSSTGLASATRAGLRTVGVPSLPRERLDATWSFGALTDPDLLAWIRTWGRTGKTAK